METLIVKPNIDKNGKNKKIFLGIVIFLGVLIGILSFDMLQPSRIQFIDKTREMTIKDHVPDLCEEFGYLSIEPKGRLGNFISQYATLYGYSKYYGISPVIDPFMRDGLRHMFKHLSIPVYTNKTCKSPFYCEVENSVLSARLLKSADCNFFVTGHPRALNYFYLYRKELIENDLALSQCMAVQVDDFLHKVTNSKKDLVKPITYVAIHVRRKDYEQALQDHHPGGGFFLSKAYYKTAMTYYRQNFENVLFVVASDDQSWCHQHLSAKDVTFTLSPNSNGGGSAIMLDMAILSKCNHSIISYGTYSFWSAYLKPAGQTLYVHSEYSNAPIYPRQVNSDTTNWKPWKDPCVQKVNGKWEFLADGKDCVK